MENKLNLDIEEVYHLMDVLHINTKNTMDLKILSEEQKKREYRL